MEARGRDRSLQRNSLLSGRRHRRPSGQPPGLAGSRRCDHSRVTLKASSRGPRYRARDCSRSALGDASPIFTLSARSSQLMAAAKIMPSRQTLRPWTVRTLIGLLAVTGMRLGEALVLTREDVDLEAGVLTIRGSKFLKSRLVPLHPSTSRALADYAQRRDACLRERWGVRDPNFFLTGRGRKFQVSQVHKAFYAISRTVGLRGPGVNRGPRLHDMRHRFATETLLRWSRSGMEIDREMPTLSTYLGHSNISRHILVPLSPSGADAACRVAFGTTLGRPGHERCPHPPIDSAALLY